MISVKQLYPSPWVSPEDVTQPVTVNIAAVTVETFRRPNGTDEDKIVLRFERARKRLPLNKTQAKTLAQLLGDDADAGPAPRSSSRPPPFPTARRRLRSARPARTAGRPSTRSTSARSRPRQRPPSRLPRGAVTPRRPVPACGRGTGRNARPAEQATQPAPPWPPGSRPAAREHGTQHRKDARTWTPRCLTSPNTPHRRRRSRPRVRRQPPRPDRSARRRPGQLRRHAAARLRHQPTLHVDTDGGKRTDMPSSSTGRPPRTRNGPPP